MFLLNSSKLGLFREKFKPLRMFLVGTGGIPVEEFWQLGLESLWQWPAFLSGFGNKRFCRNGKKMYLYLFESRYADCGRHVPSRYSGMMNPPATWAMNADSRGRFGAD